MNHYDYLTHMDNKEDRVYLTSTLLPVNIRLVHSSPQYKEIIKQQIEYIKWLCLTEKEGYSKPYGMSTANAGLGLNIIGITVNRNKENEYCKILINPIVISASKEKITSQSNCGSLTLEEPIKIERHLWIEVEYYTESFEKITERFYRENQGLSIQHEIDHNDGILITEREVKQKKWN